MGKMQEGLKQLLHHVGKVTDSSLRYPSVHDVTGSNYANEVQRVYRDLGGILPTFPLRLCAWDIEFESIAVELDEYLHFNQYRDKTLESSAYQDLKAFPLNLYREYCASYEEQCLQAGGYGGKWSNPSCEAQFGAAAEPKDLSGGGAPRWKQRAFYDFVKDLSPLVIGVPVVRLAVWDLLEDGKQSRTIEAVLQAPSTASAEALKRLISDRDPRRLAA